MICLSNGHIQALGLSVLQEAAGSGLRELSRGMPETLASFGPACKRFCSNALCPAHPWARQGQSGPSAPLQRAQGCPCLGLPLSRGRQQSLYLGLIAPAPQPRPRPPPWAPHQHPFLFYQYHLLAHLHTQYIVASNTEPCLPDFITSVVL